MIVERRTYFQSEKKRNSLLFFGVEIRMQLNLIKVNSDNLKIQPIILKNIIFFYGTFFSSSSTKESNETS